MDLNALKSFAREARKELLKSVSFKLEITLSDNSLARRENYKAVIELENKIKTSSKQEVIEEVSYTWFNRFTALQYMDVNNFNDVKIILPSNGQTRPEILSNAISGIFDNNLISENNQNIISSLLDGRTSNQDPEMEAYRLLLVSFCNKLHSKMPFLFERISDYTELLVPDDLLSNKSILAKIREVMTEKNCKDVEVIGWVYQFYISEKKEQVFKRLKKNQKITPENIPAATQLFTPHWIVKYLVENSLGRIWMLNNPNSNLINSMEYYTSPKENETNIIEIQSPEEIKICDPACGSGHMLTYAFDLLYLIYEEEGYDKETIPSLIIKNNLFGIEIDQRAGSLAAFALTMKAKFKQKKFFDYPIQPNICVLKKILFDNNEIENYINEMGSDLFTFSFQNTLKQFEEIDNLGSLIIPELKEVDIFRKKLESKDISNNLFLNSTHRRIMKVLSQVDYLSQKYHVVIANPPYMGLKGMNIKMMNFLKKNYSEVKYDLFAAFIVRNTKLALDKGQLGFMTPNVWMYISSYEKLRMFLTEKFSINSLVELPLTGFKGATVQICAFNINCSKEKTANFIRLVDFRGGDDEMARYTINAVKNKDCGWFYKVESKEFKAIPGSPIAYWITRELRNCFKQFPLINQSANAVCGMTTGENARFVRYWYEVSNNKFGKNIGSNEDALQSKKKWFPYAKGGDFRKWYGNAESVVNWENNGKEIIESGRASPRAKQNYFQPSVSWTFISSSYFGVRQQPKGFIFDMAGCSLFPDDPNQIEIYTGLLCSKTAFLFLNAINPTLNIQVNNVASIPLPKGNNIKIKEVVKQCILIAKEDWDSYETSWNFQLNPILSINSQYKSLKKTYDLLRNHWGKMITKMSELEEQNNLIFINAYGLQEEITPDVPIHEITLRCNPSYRYGKKVSPEEQEVRLLADTIKEYISYSVGCMFGRYSLEKPGLIIANQDQNLEDYLKKVPNTSFLPDQDNVIPILKSNWFEDDITARFKKFLKVTFGDENFEENLRFIEKSIEKDIRKYFLNDFYKDHIQIYKKRPIYWMFSSPKGTFNALIYIHRYEKDTVSILLDKYLSEFLGKLRAEKNTLERLEITNSVSNTEKTKAMREIQQIDSALNELQNWQKEVIFPLASQRLELDLDNGVKVNYPKFGTALKKVSGLN